MTSAVTSTWNRCRLRGTLTLTSPLVLGDGNTREGIKTDQEETPLVACVARDIQNRPLIPGSSLKGVLRNYLSRQIQHSPDRVALSRTIDKLFGRGPAEKDALESTPDSGQGGSVEFEFSYASTPVESNDMNSEQAVSLDRVTRTAADRKLFAYDVVPENTEFAVSAIGYQLNSAEVDLLCQALEGFNHRHSPVRLGASTANHYGTARWRFRQIEVLGRPQIERWLSRSDVMADAWHDAVHYVPLTEPLSTSTGRHRLQIDLTLQFESWFLVKDPRCGKENSPILTGTDSYPRLTRDQHVLLPPRSFRGAFRSQIERIARTLCGEIGGDPNRAQNPSLIEALFGFSGGRAVLKCGRFIDHLPAQEVTSKPLPADVQEGRKRGLFTREFVAIDRFTGGAAEHLKFDCVAAWRPDLRGSVSVDLDDLQTRCHQLSQGLQNPIRPAAALGLLFLGLRDLSEGDIAFGLGASKGFGQCRATFRTVLTGSDHDTLCSRLGISLEQWRTEVTDAGTGMGACEFEEALKDPLTRTIATHSVAQARSFLMGSTGRQNA